MNRPKTTDRNFEVVNQLLSLIIFYYRTRVTNTEIIKRSSQLKALKLSFRLNIV